MQVEMTLARILINEHHDAQLLELRELNPLGPKPRTIPILIGLAQAIAIDQRLSGFEIGRPMTQDLLSNTITKLNATLDSIAITHIVEGTFFAQLQLTNHNNEQVIIDARPSDAIALGITNDVPIFVDEQVIQSASIPKL